MNKKLLNKLLLGLLLGLLWTAPQQAQQAPEYQRNAPTQEARTVSSKTQNVDDEKFLTSDQQGSVKVWIKNRHNVYVQRGQSKSRLIARAPKDTGFTYPYLSPNGKWLLVNAASTTDRPNSRVEQYNVLIHVATGKQLSSPEDFEKQLRVSGVSLNDVLWSKDKPASLLKALPNNQEFDLPDTLPMKQ